MALNTALFCLIAAAISYVRVAYKQRRVEQDYDAIALHHGCQPPNRLQNQRLLGLDRLEQIFRAAAEFRLMDLFLSHFDRDGDTIEHCFLRKTAYGTNEPANIEAILSTNHDDWETSNRRAIMSPLFGDGILTQEGLAWKQSRDHLRPAGKSPILIRKGRTVAWSVYSMHRRTDLFGLDCDTFRPERWDEYMPLCDDSTNKAWGYLPFHGGPRKCLGMDFALTEAAYAISRILWRYRVIKLPESIRVKRLGREKQTLTLVLASTDGCKVQICA